MFPGTYTSPNAIADLERVDDKNVPNRLVFSSGGVDSFLNTIDDQRVITGNHTATTVLVGNRDAMVFINTSAGNAIVTLPLIASHSLQPIRIKNIGTGAFTLTVNCSGTDKIEDPYNPITTPTATSVVLRNPDATITIYPTGTAWRILGSSGFNLLCALFKNTVQSTANTTFTSVTFGAGTELRDLAQMHDTAVNTSRITVPSGGTYLLDGVIRFTDSASGNTSLGSFLRNGVTSITPGAVGPKDANGRRFVALKALTTLSAGDYVEMQGYQDSGGALNISESLFMLTSVL